MAEFKLIPRVDILPPSEPMRVAMGDQAMDELIASINDQGVLQSLLVAPAGDKWEIVDGHRRYIATGKCGIDFLPCLIFDSPEAARYAAMLDANVCREDVTPAEEGQQFFELSEKYGWSLEQLCEKFHKSEHYINARVDVATKDAEIRDAVNARQLTLAQATELLHEKDEERRHVRLLLTLEHGYNARELRQMRHNLEGERIEAAGGVRPHTPEFIGAQEPAAEPECVWCGERDNQHMMHVVHVHSYHEREVRAVIERVCVKNLLRPTESTTLGE